jgi:hypothetical protein
MNNDIILKSDNQVKLELNKQSSKEIINIDTNLVKPRYGTSIDLKTNKVELNTDKRLLRDQHIPISNKYNISRLHIDSRYRQLEPSNIISNYIILPNNPFSFVQGSNVMTINLGSNNTLYANQFITISDLVPNVITMRNSTMTFKINSTYIYINQINHGFTGNTNTIEITGVTSNNYFIGNIPLSLINKVHTVILIYNNGILDLNNYLLDTGIYCNANITYPNDNYDINVRTLNGIDIKYINSSFPLTNNIQQGYLIVNTVINNNITVILSQVATKTTTSSDYSGNSNIKLGIITSTITGFPNPEFYQYNLKKTYYKVKKIKLVSTEFPNTQLLIKTNINDTLYWQILEDGNNIYSVKIPSGNYDGPSLTNAITNAVNSIPRIFSSILNKDLYYQNCIANISINTNTNIFQMQILANITLTKCIIMSDELYTDGYNRVIIIHPYNYLNVGDTITLSGVIGVKDNTSTSGITYYIPSNIINSTFKIESIVGLNNYILKLPKYNPVQDPTVSSFIVNGGNAINIQFAVAIRLLFNQPNTFGSIFGFKNLGDATSITPFGKIITNQTLYENATNINTVGTINTNLPILNFTTYPYILMVSTLFNNNIKIQDSTGIFAKLFLAGSSDTFIYDQYVQINQDIPAVVSFLNQLEFKFYTPDGNTYNFNGIDHSYTLEIYEELDTL